VSDKQIFRLCPKPHPSRANACAAIERAPDGYIVELKPPTRSLIQNKKLWAMLGDISKQVVWYGVKYESDDWKDILTASLRKELRTAPNVDGNGIVVLGMRTSQMTVGQMNELIAFMDAFGSQQGVKWSDPEEIK
jgi:hypothetical protein